MGIHHIGIMKWRLPIYWLTSKPVYMICTDSRSTLHGFAPRKNRMHSAQGWVYTPFWIIKGNPYVSRLTNLYDLHWHQVDILWFCPSRRNGSTACKYGYTLHWDNQRTSTCVLIKQFLWFALASDRLHLASPLKRARSTTGRYRYTRHWDNENTPSCA